MLLSCVWLCLFLHTLTSTVRARSLIFPSLTGEKIVSLCIFFLPKLSLYCRKVKRVIEWTLTSGVVLICCSPVAVRLKDHFHFLCPFFLWAWVFFHVPQSLRDFLAFLVKFIPRSFFVFSVVEAFYLLPSCWCMWRHGFLYINFHYLRVLKGKRFSVDSLGM